MHLAAFLAIVFLAADWPGWRGSQHDALVTEEPKNFPEKLTLKWRIDVGEGHSSPILAAGSIYAFARKSD